MAPQLELEVNGQKYPVHSDPDTRLLTVLRDELGLTGTKYGCGEGQCGACTVLIGVSPRRSCQTLLGEVVQPVTTIEGLEKDGHLHPVQQAFLDLEAFQCAFCTSGMIISSVALLAQKPNPWPTEIMQFMQGNICRCGTYPRIVDAIQRAAKNTEHRPR
jgi:aerobic-type carbon monoxide dehydrogenase small subunit (CoxS/CutS family)